MNQQPITFVNITLFVIGIGKSHNKYARGKLSGIAKRVSMIDTLNYLYGKIFHIYGIFFHRCITGWYTK